MPLSVYVIDANLVVSAAHTPDGISRRALIAARSSGTIALSDAVHAEIADVLARPKFSRVLTEDRRREILELLSAAALWVEPQQVIKECRDPRDNLYLELAVAAGATVLVTGDLDLLHPWRGVQELRPADFLSFLQA